MEEQKKPYLKYDESDIINAQVSYLKEMGEYPEKTEQELYDLASGDEFIFQDEWDNFKGELTEILNEIDKNKNSLFKVKGKNMGWRHLEGYKTLRANNGEELLNEILPKTNEFSLSIWKTKTQIFIRCSHHDAPTGEFYYIKPLNKKEVKNFNLEEY